MTKIDIITKSETAFEALKGAFSDCKDVNILFKDVLDIDTRYDCIATAGNSFGLMDGGFDSAIRKKLGRKLEIVIQNFILTEYEGEIPVGCAFPVQANVGNVSFVIYAPTMRVPGPVVGSENAYLATKAVLKQVRSLEKKGHKIERILIPSMCTYYGNMSPQESARQMKLAFQYFLNPPKKITANFARQRDAEVKGTTMSEQDFSYLVHPK